MSIDDKDVTQIGGKTFQPSDYNNPSQLSQVMAITHEQVSDVYMAGSSDGVTFLEGGKVCVNSPEKEASAPE